MDGVLCGGVAGIDDGNIRAVDKLLGIWRISRRAVLQVVREPVLAREFGRGAAVCRDPIPLEHTRRAIPVTHKIFRKLVIHGIRHRRRIGRAGIPPLVALRGNEARRESEGVRVSVRVSVRA